MRALWTSRSKSLKPPPRRDSVREQTIARVQSIVEKIESVDPGVRRRAANIREHDKENVLANEAVNSEIPLDVLLSTLGKAEDLSPEPTPSPESAQRA